MIEEKLTKFNFNTNKMSAKNEKLVPERIINSKELNPQISNQNLQIFTSNQIKNIKTSVVETQKPPPFNRNTMTSFMAVSNLMKLLGKTKKKH